MFPPRSYAILEAWTYSDGYAARGRVWAAPGRPAKRLVLYLHGIQSHGGWYEWSASRLAGDDRVVVLPDRRGSGMNAAQRGDTPSAQRWLDDLDELCAWARQRFGISRIALVLVSWGAKLGLAWAARRATLVDCALLIGPGLFPRVDIGVGGRLSVAWALLRGAPLRMLPIPLQDPALFTDNPAGQAFIAADTRKLEHVTARFMLASRRLDGWNRGLRRGDLPARVTALLAGDDRIAHTERTRDWLKKTFGANVAIQILENAQHTMEFAADRSAFEKALAGWSASLGEFSGG